MPLQINVLPSISRLFPWVSDESCISRTTSSTNPASPIQDCIMFSSTSNFVLLAPEPKSRLFMKSFFIFLGALALECFHAESFHRDFHPLFSKVFWVCETFSIFHTFFKVVKVTEQSSNSFTSRGFDKIFSEFSYSPWKARCPSVAGQDSTGTAPSACPAHAGWNARSIHITTMENHHNTNFKVVIKRRPRGTQNLSQLLFWTKNPLIIE